MSKLLHSSTSDGKGIAGSHSERSVASISGNQTLWASPAGKLLAPGLPIERLDTRIPVSGRPVWAFWFPT